MDHGDLSPGDVQVRQFEERRPALFRLAYRMLGSVVEAEDIVQEAYLRWHNADKAAVDEPRRYLTTIVTRLCLDHLKSARVKRESYVGAWLPEPLVDTMASEDTNEGFANDLSVALMLTLERLSPLERAAFLLHDVFDLDFDAVAKILGRTNATCRRLASRARIHVRSSPARYSVNEKDINELTEAFRRASFSGDVATVQHLLTNDAVLITDGGGKKPAALNPIYGSGKIARFFAGLVHKFGYTLQPGVETIRINGLPGYVTIEVGDVLQTTALEFEGDLVSRIYIVRNPDKLAHLRTGRDRMEAPRRPGN